MPLVRVCFKPEFPYLAELKNVCREIVPAAFNSPQGPLTPGSIKFFAREATPLDDFDIDVFIEIESYDLPDRTDVQRRCDDIMAALKVFFPSSTTFAIWPKLVKAGWACDTEDPEFDGDMSIEAAIHRAWAANRNMQAVRS